MDNDSTCNGGPLSFADTLSPLERAALGLQASLSLFEVGKLTFPDNAKFQQSLVQTLISNAKMGNLPVYGNPDGWESRTCEETRNFRLGTVKRVFENPFPATNLHQGTTGPISFGCYLDSPNPLPTKKEWAGNCCLVSRADYFAFLKTPLALGIPSPANWLPPPTESILPESPLPLNERARLGLLVAETELPVWEILELEFPTKSSRQRGEYADWQETIEIALRRGLLASRPETRITQGETCLTGDWLIDRESYRQWRVTQPNPPAGSHIHKWLGAMPALPESIPPVETSLSEPSKRGGIALVEAENAALVALRKELKHEPTANQWLNYWKSGKDTEGTIKEVTCSEVVWIGKDNQVHRTALTSMNNRFSKAKKRNPFTPS